MRDLIVSLAIDGREKYSHLVKGLERTLAVSTADKTILKSFQSWITPHTLVPYKFKYDIIAGALSRGYNRVWWLDSTMRLLKDPFELFDGRPVVAFDNLGHPLGNYITTAAAANMELSDTNIQQCWGGAIGWDFASGAGAILEEVDKQVRLGSFIDDGTAKITHRHDQAVMSGLLYNAGIKLLPYGIIAAAKDVTDKTYIQYGD